MEGPVKIFSYVVDHDYGYAPNASSGACLLSHCKFSTDGRRKNVLESVRVGDWIVGTGGSSGETAKADRIVYAMMVEEKIPIAALFKDVRFKKTAEAAGYPKNRSGCRVHGKEFVVSFREFGYFGKNAIKIPRRFLNFRTTGESLKAHRGYKTRFSKEFVRQFLSWVNQLPKGKVGEPSASNNHGDGRRPVNCTIDECSNRRVKRGCRKAMLNCAESQLITRQ